MSANEKKNKNSKRSSLYALLPIGVFVVSYVTLIILCNESQWIKEFFSFSTILPCFFLAFIVALIQYHKVSFKEKFRAVGRGISDKSITSMILILILAGAFAGVVGRTSASSVAFFMLDIIPPQFCVGVLFVVACLVSLAMGTSVGSITLITPIAIMVSGISGQDVAICVGSVIGGSMFGDNLSMISDTTIASCSGQDCNMRDKFFANFKMVVPAALITLVIILVLTINEGNQEPIHNTYDLIEFIPYVLVLIIGVCGVNVFIVLGVGIVSGLIIELIQQDVDFINIIYNMLNGVASMLELILVTLCVAAMASLIKRNGGFDVILRLLERFCKTRKTALLGTGFMVGALDLIVANNTVAIVIANPIAKEVGRKYKIKKQRIASTLDIFSCIFQGLIPYGAQILIASGFLFEAGMSVSSIELMPYCIYQYVLFFIVILSIATGFIVDKAPEDEYLSEDATKDEKK